MVTTDQGVRAGKTIPLKEIVDEAVEGCECVKKVFVSRRTGADVAMAADRDVQLEQVSSLTHSQITHPNTQCSHTYYMYMYSIHVSHKKVYPTSPYYGCL